MKTQVEVLENNRIKMTVTVEAKDIDSAIKKAYKDAAFKHNFPGFRKGKAPRPVIDNAFGPQYVLANVTDDLISECYPASYEAEQIFPTGKPDFGEVELVEEGKDYTFTFEVPVKPEVELSDYSPVAIELPSEKATDAEIQDQIDALKEYYFTYEDAPKGAKVADDVRATIALKAVDNNGNEVANLCDDEFQYSFGSGYLPEEFEAAIAGKKIGDKGSVTFNVPEEPLVFTSSLVGVAESVSCDFEIKALSVRSYPELTDEYVKEKLGFEGVDELRERVAESIEMEKGQFIPQLKERRCLVELLKRIDVEVPEAMKEDTEASLMQDFFQQLQRNGATLDQYLKQQDITNEEFKEDLKKQAEEMCKENLALDAWARNKGIVVTDEDITEEFAKAGVEDPAKLEKEWRSAGQMYIIREGISRSKAVRDLMDTAVVTEVDLLPSSEEAAE